MDNETYVKDNLTKFDLFFEKVQEEGCDLLKKLMDEAWYKEARPLVQIPWQDSSKQYDLICDPYIWFGNGDCCDNSWDLVNKSIPLLIEKTKKIKSLRNKLDSIKEGDFYQTLDTIFELFVLYRFSNLIVDTERKVTNDSGSNVDAVIKLNDREVLLEASRISKNLVNPNIRTGTMSVAEMIEQVLRKLDGKAGKNSQLGLAQVPSILAICLPNRGATQETAQWALEANLHLFPRLGIVIVSYNYNFQGCKWYINTQANYPFTDCEIEQLKKILWQTEPLVIGSNTVAS